MVDVNKYYESENAYIKAIDLPPGKEVPVTISKIDEGEFENDNKKSTKLILFFAGKEKGLVLNKTNATTIAAAYGPESDGWIDKKIYLYQTKVSFGDSMVDAVRVRAELSQVDPNDDIPF